MFIFQTSHVPVSLLESEGLSLSAALHAGHGRKAEGLGTCRGRGSGKTRALAEGGGNPCTENTRPFILLHRASVQLTAA